MAVMRGNCAGRNWLMKWDELKKFPWYTHRLMHDSYFRLMTIKHAISKIEQATEWALNYYITQSRQKSEFQLEMRCGKESHTSRRDSVPLIELGSREVADKMQSRKPSPSSPGERERHNVDGHKSGVKILQFIFGLQLPLTVKPHATLSNPYNKVRGIFC